MRAVVQRVTEGRVVIDGQIVGEIGKGLVVLLGVGAKDSIADVEYIAQKLVGLRIFADDEDKMNLSVQDVQGEILLVSQFTLHGDVRKGKRPSYSHAAAPEVAQELYEQCARLITQHGIPVATGVFGAMMQVEIHNDGPVTILLDSERLF